MGKQDYIENVYNALSKKVDGFNKTPEDFRSRITTDAEYAANVYKALSSKVEGFKKTEDEFYNSLGLKKKEQTIQSGGVPSGTLSKPSTSQSGQVSPRVVPSSESSSVSEIVPSTSNLSASTEVVSSSTDGGETPVMMQKQPQPYQEPSIKPFGGKPIEQVVSEPRQLTPQQQSVIEPMRAGVEKAEQQFQEEIYPQKKERLTIDDITAKKLEQDIPPYLQTVRKEMESTSADIKTGYSEKKKQLEQAEKDAFAINSKVKRAERVGESVPDFLSNEKENIVDFISANGSTDDVKLINDQYRLSKELMLMGEVPNNPVLQKKQKELMSQIEAIKAKRWEDVTNEINKLEKDLKDPKKTSKELVKIKDQIAYLNGLKSNVFETNPKKIAATAKAGDSETAYNIFKVMPTNISDKEKFDLFYSTLFEKNTALANKIGVGKRMDEASQDWSPAMFKMTVKDLFNKENLTRDEKEFLENESILRTLYPVYVLNETEAISSEQGFWSSLLDGFNQSMYPTVLKTRAKKDIDYAQETKQILQEIGVPESSLVKENVEAINRRTTPSALIGDGVNIVDPSTWGGFDINTEKLGDLTGTSAGFMTKLAISEAPLALLSGSGSLLARGAQIADKAGKITKLIDRASDLHKRYNETSKLYSKILVPAVEQAARFEVAGQVFQNDEDDLNWKSGLVGGVFGGAVKGVMSNKATTYMYNKAFDVFGKDAPKAIIAIKNLGKRMGAVATEATGEVFEEFGEELVDIHRSTSGTQGFFDELRNRFGTWSDAQEFILSSYILGLGMNLKPTSRFNDLYKSLPEQEKANVNQVIAEITAENKINETKAFEDASAEVLTEEDVKKFDETEAKEQPEIKQPEIIKEEGVDTEYKDSEGRFYSEEEIIKLAEENKLEGFTITNPSQAVEEAITPKAEEETQEQETESAKQEEVKTEPAQESEEEFTEEQERDEAYELRELYSKLEDAENNKIQEGGGEMPEVIIAKVMGRINREDAERETGGKVGRKQDINPSLVKKNGPPVDAMATNIKSDFFAKNDIVTEEFIQEVIRDILVTGAKSDYIAKFIEDVDTKTIKKKIKEIEARIEQREKSKRKKEDPRAFRKEEFKKQKEEKEKKKQAKEGKKEDDSLPFQAYSEKELETASKDEPSAKKKRTLKSALAVTKALKKVAPGMKVVVHNNQESYGQAVVEAGGREADASTRGFYLDKSNTIHVNSEMEAENTIFHEGAHPLIEAIAKDNPEAIEKLHAELEALKGVKGVKEVLKWADNNYTPQQAKKEAVVEFLSRVATGEISLKDVPKASLDKIMDMINELLEMIGFANYKIENNADIQEIAKKFKSALDAGKAIDVAGAETTGEAQFQGSLDGKPATFKRLPESILIVDGWYSPIEKRLRETKAEKQSANKWLTGGFIGKGDEAVYTGVKGWLESKNPQEQVSKQEILDWMKDNRVEIVEVVKGDELPNYKLSVEPPKSLGVSRMDLLRDLSKAERIDNPRFIAYLFNKYGDDGIQIHDWLVDNVEVEGTYSKDTKYQQYQLEGEKENYKEVLVTMPVKNKDTSNAQKAYDEYKQSLRNKYGENYKGSQLTDEEIDIQLELKEATKQPKTEQFKSSHFDEPNILVHLRMNTRTDVDGNKVLFLEEVQSDWGQKGKREGFATPESSNRIKEINARLIDIANDISAGKVKKGDVVEEQSELIKERDRLQKSERTPTAPFVTETPSWVKLGLKTALKEAARQGADKIAWTTGEQQNDRYDLSKQVDVIDGKRNKDGTYEITATKDGSKIFGKSDMPLKEIEDTFGKDVAEKINNSKSPLITISGDNLKAGGKGMKGFYDNIVPSVAKSLVKELTGKEGVVGEAKIEIDRQSDFSSYYQEGSAHIVEYTTSEGKKEKVFRDEESARDFMKTLDRSSFSTQQSIEITPELKASVEEGMPMFQKGVPREINKFLNDIESAGERDLYNEDTLTEDLVDVFGIPEQQARQIAENFFEPSKKLEKKVEVKKSEKVAPQKKDEEGKKKLSRKAERMIEADSSLSQEEKDALKKEIEYTELDTKALANKAEGLIHKLGNEGAIDFVSDPSNDVDPILSNYTVTQAFFNLQEEYQKNPTQENKAKVIRAREIFNETSLQNTLAGQMNAALAEMYNRNPKMRMLKYVEGRIGETKETALNSSPEGSTATNGSIVEELRQTLASILDGKIDNNLEEMRRQDPALDKLMKRLEEKKNVNATQKESKRKEKTEEQKQKAREQIEEGKRELLKALRGSGNLNMAVIPGVTPETISALGKIISGYIKLGALNTTQIINSIAKFVKENGLTLSRKHIKEIARQDPAFRKEQAKEGKEYKKLLEENGLTIGDVVKSHYFNKQYTGDLAQELAESLTINRVEAKELADIIQKNLDALIEAEAERTLNRLLPKEDTLTEEEKKARKLKQKEARKTINKVAKAVHSGGLNNETFLDAFAESLGFTSIPTETKVELEYWFGKLYDLGFFDENRSDIENKFLIGKAQRKLNSILDQLKPRDAAFYARYFSNDLHQSVLTGIATTIGKNALLGSVYTATINAIGKTFIQMFKAPASVPYGLKKSLSKDVWKSAWANFMEAARNNYSLYDYQIIEGATTDTMSQQEIDTLYGAQKAFDKLKQDPKSIKDYAKLLWFSFKWPQRITSLLKAYDAYINTQLGEYYIAMDEWNRVSSEIKTDGAGEKIKRALGLDKDFMNTLNNTLAYDKKDQARKKAEAEYNQGVKGIVSHVDELIKEGKLPESQREAKIKEIKIASYSKNFVNIRAQEILTEQRNEDAVKATVIAVKDSVMMGQPDGLAGMIYEKVTERVRVKDTDPAVYIAAKSLLFTPKTMFFRVTTNFANAVQTGIPVYGALHAFTGLNWNTNTEKKKSLKDPSTWFSNKYKENPEQAMRRFSVNMLTTAMLIYFMMANFDLEDEEEDEEGNKKSFYSRLKLREDRKFDFSSVGFDSSVKNKQADPDYQEVAVRPRNDDGSWMPWMKTNLVPQINVPVYILGRITEDKKGMVKESSKDRRESLKGIATMPLEGFVNSLAQGSFVSMGRDLKTFVRNDDKLDAITTIITESSINPIKSIIQPAWARDLSQTIQHYRDKNQKYPRGYKETFLNNFYLFESYAQDKTDVFGNPYKVDTPLQRAYGKPFSTMDEHEDAKLLYKFEGGLNVPMYRAKKELTIGDKKIKLEEKDQRELSETQKKIFKVLVNQNLDNLSNADKATLQAYMDAYREQANSYAELYMLDKKQDQFKFPSIIEDVNEILKKHENYIKK
jgi:hypothetical protein